MLYMYPAIFHEENGYWVEFPDLEGCHTQGDSMEETLFNAKEALELYMLALLEEGCKIPMASNVRDIEVVKDSFIVVVDVDVDLAKNTKSVRKNCTIPGWLNEKAEKEGINFSKVLQEALIEKLAM